MSGTKRLEALVKILLALALGMAGLASPRLVDSAYAQVTTTTVADTVYHADGTAAAGTLIVSWPTFTTMTGSVIQAGSESVTIGPGGALSVGLAPNVGATPIGSYYTVVYHLDDGSVTREYWVIPVSGSSVTVAAVKNTVIPTSVAMQTVSKSYVDTAIAVALAGHPADSSPYVVKTGDTMTGPLVLPADPVSANQAADKHYVDAGVATVASGLGQKVALNPTGNQVVLQPAGTDLEVSRLDGIENSTQYAVTANIDGIANATASSDCTAGSAAGLGCVVNVAPTVTKQEGYAINNWPDSTHVVDMRSGGQHDTFFNPKNPFDVSSEVGHEVDVFTTTSSQGLAAIGVQEPQSVATQVVHAAFTGGNNLFPAEIESVPYFKTNYVGQVLTGIYNTAGQHILNEMTTNCFSVGDCLLGSQFLNSMGGYRDNSDEGTHPFDIEVLEDLRVYAGTCTTGCTTGSQSVRVSATSNPGTQGDGRFLIDKNPAKVISTGSLTGGAAGTIHPTATFSGTTFGVSTFFETAALITSQARNVAPGTVTVAIVTSGVPAGYSTNTAAAPSGSGVACVAGQATRFPNYEMAAYTVVDGSHLQMTLAKPHGANSTIAIGGLCGYGLEQTVDTVNGIRQVFPVIGSTSATSLVYAAGETQIVGQTGTTSAFANLSASVVSASRSGNVVTLSTTGIPQDVSGLTMTVAGVADSSYNGTFPVVTTSATTLTYNQTGANSTSTGGTISLLTGGYALYPMAEVASVYDPASKSVNGLFTLAANTVPWAVNDVVEQPHYFQMKINGDVTYVNQTQPRQRNYQSVGYQYNDNNGPGLRGFQIQNTTPASSYYGNGGTHSYPDTAYLSAGIWGKVLDAEAGELATFALHCNSKGCNRWNSAYDLFQLDSSAGVDTINYQPNTSGLTFNLRGTGYTFTPLAFGAGTANITTLNATTVNAGTVNMGASTSTSVATGGLTATSVASTGALSGSSLSVTGAATAATVNAGTVTATTLNGALDASNMTSGTLNAARLPVMGASGGSHAAGAVPDPGATAGTTRYLREDGTWVSPAGGMVSFNGRSGVVAPASGDYGVAQVTGAAALASPALTGTPTAPTPTVGDNSTKIPTTAFVTTAVTNAANSGVLTGDVTKAAGATAASVVKVNGAAIPVLGDALVSDAGGHLVGLRRIAHLFCIGDSYVQGVGAINQQEDSGCALLARDTPATYENRGVQGTTMPQVANSAFLYAYQDPVYPNAFLNDGGLNDSNNDACGSTAGTNCVKNYQQTMLAMLDWETVPSAYRIRASAAASTGTYTADTTVPLYIPAYTTALGNAVRLTSSGATTTFNIPSSASTRVRLTYGVYNGATGTFTVAVDGVNQTDVCSGTTTFTASGCGGQALAGTTSAPFAQEFTVTAGTTHTVLVTTTNAVVVPLISVSWNPPATVANVNPVFLMGTPNISSFGTGTGVYDTAAKTIANGLAAEGLPVYFVDLRNGTPGLNNTTDVGATATAVCPATLSTGHPNSGSGCGYDHMAQTIYNTELANGWQFSTYNGGGEAVARQGVINVPIQQAITMAAGAPHSKVFNFLNTNLISPLGSDWYQNASTAIGYGWTLSDSSSGKPWSGKAATMNYAASGQMALFRLWNSNTGSATNADSQFVTHAAIDYATGTLYTDGSIVGTGAAPTIAAGTGSGGSPTVTVAGSNMAGVINVTAGSSPAASAILGTVTFNGTVTVAPKGCSVFPQNAASAGVALYLAGAPTTAGWVLDVGSAALTAGTAYSWSYSCF